MFDPLALTTLAQADPAPSSPLTSVGAIILATFIIVAIAKALLPGIKGRWTLGVSLVVACLLTGVALFVTKTLAEDPITALIAVLAAIAGAAGLDVSGKTLLTGSAKVLAPVALVLLLTGCNGAPGSLVTQHVDTAGANHLERVRAAAEDPPRVIPASALEVETWESHWQSIDAAGESAR